MKIGFNEVPNRGKIKKGNYILVNRDITQINNVFEQVIMNPHNLFEPIQLTNNILLNIGFRKFYNEYIIEFKNSHGSILEFTFDEYFQKGIKNLHELQNIFEDIYGIKLSITKRMIKNIKKTQKHFNNEKKHDND